MTTITKSQRRAEVDRAVCVACGCCLKVCPLSAIEVYRGVYARVDQRRCVGCGLCVGECPAGVISVREVQA